MEINKILIIVLILNIILIGIIAFFMQGAVNKCLGDPLLYGAEKLSKLNNAEFSCSCSLNKPNSPLIFFDSKNMSVEYPTSLSNSNNFNFDFSNVEVQNVS